MYAIEDLISSQSVEQVKAFLYNVAGDLGLATTAWQKLSPLRTVFAIASTLFSGYTEVQVAVARSGFLDFAEGGGLTLLAKYVYGVLRNEATFATGQVTVDNAGGGLYPYAAGDLVFLNSTTKKTYVNTSAVTINPLQTGVVIDIAAVELGSASTAAPGQINAFSSAAPSLSVTNALAVIGDDEETDPALRLRCILALAALSPNGAPNAYGYIALTFTLNGGVNVTRYRVLDPPGDGTVTIALAGPDGALTGGEVTTVDDNIQATVVREVDTAFVVSATNQVVVHVVDVWYSSKSGLTDSDVITLAQAAIINYYPTVPIGGVPLQGGPTTGVPWRAVEGAIEAASPYILEAKLQTETDVVLTALQVAVPSAPTVLPHQVAA